jgi:glycosyltransferase involved in cell wall biosynthesis
MVMRADHTGTNVCTISVIVPVYNHEAWVAQALHSILQQTYQTLELIVIDDASSDQSWSIVQQVCQQYPNTTIHCLQHATNQGAAATLNEGLRLATGDYIAILNSDDAWHSQRLASLITYAQAVSADFLGTDVGLIDGESAIITEQSEPHWLAWFMGLKQDYQQQQDLLATVLQGNLFISTSNFFMHKRVLATVGEFKDLRYVHDYDYILRVLSQGFKAEILPDTYLSYRLHRSNTIREQPLAAIRENMGMLLGYLPTLSACFDDKRLQGLQIQLQNLYRYTQEEWQTDLHLAKQATEQPLLALIQDRDQWIVERDSWISERDVWIAERDSLIQQQAKAISDLAEQAAHAQQQLQSQAQWLLDRDQWIQERDTWIAERDGLINSLQSHLQQHQHWVLERDTWIADRERWIVERDLLIQQQAQHIQLQQQWVADRDAWIAERDTWIVERDQLIQQLRQQQRQLTRSWSYRLGHGLLAPLRWLRFKRTSTEATYYA